MTGVAMMTHGVIQSSDTDEPVFLLCDNAWASSTWRDHVYFCWLPVHNMFIQDKQYVGE